MGVMPFELMITYDGTSGAVRAAQFAPTTPTDWHESTRRGPRRAVALRRIADTGNPRGTHGETNTVRCRTAIEVRRGVDELARSVTEIEIALRAAERTIEADARDRIRRLRDEARGQLALLRSYEREAIRIVTRLSAAANGSWGDLDAGANRALKDARKVADAMIKRFRRIVASGQPGPDGGPAD
jgi:hypothetical protein